MEISEFAGRVLFSHSLEEKLLSGGLLTDDNPGKALTTPSAPGRPSGLGMRRGDGRAPFPADHRLVNEDQRGILLHFLANHELLATELMALVLLKFPEAPASFRRGIVRTLHEEQIHTRWYLQRMSECNVCFGDLPLNRFFWDAVAPMESALDYVTRLSLTFEQANLDYARHYAKVLREAGDPSTAVILEAIYRDEIAHVGYGLKWFRRWKPPALSDWEAYRAGLRFPLSPGRGKGNVAFNAEGRIRAGLTGDFVREMEVFEHSKGRTPNLFWFNPHAEASIAAGSAGFQPRAALAALARDLEILPCFLSRRDDVVLMATPPALQERARLQSLGLALPECEALSAAGAILPQSALRTRKLNEFRPWAWAPESAALFEPLTALLPGGAHHIGQYWNPARAELFSKVWALQRRRELFAAVDSLDPAVEGSACRTLEEVEATLARLRAADFASVVLKAPLGTSGQKNLRLLAGEPFSEALRQWTRRILDRQKAVVVEPWLERVHDFSVQYEMTGAGLTQVAPIHLINDPRGQFRACRCGPRFGQGLSGEVARFLIGDGRISQAPLGLYDGALRHILEKQLSAAGFSGPLGVDAFVYRTANGELKLQPLVEINPRYTMGRLTWELMRRVAPGRTVHFELVNRALAAQAGAESLSRYAAITAEKFPPLCDSSGRLISGSVILNDAAKATQVLAVLSLVQGTGGSRKPSRLGRPAC